ncbi:MFS transporter [Arthrobacter sp. NA-172]|uniref:MFS transporter n=1 Tax=Arthrobacter sp. NA-172 TaxID=3367524 RepID=UPI0037546095
MTEQSTAAISGGPRSSDQGRRETESGPEGKSSARKTRVRWLMAFLCFAGLAINYIDRANLSVALPFVTKDFHLDPIQAGLLLGAFSWTYTAFQVPGGWFIDRFGAKIMFPIAVGLWSLFTIVTAFCTGFASFFIARLGLGIGESGAYPASAKVVSTWFPASERGKATAFYDSGARIGSALAVPISAFIIAGYGWQAAFIITGLLGLFWVVGWFVTYRDPEKHRKVNSAELDHIRNAEAVDDGAAVVKEIPGFRWWHLFRYRAVWAMMIGFFCINFVITFFLTWFPSYLIPGTRLRSSQSWDVRSYTRAVLHPRRLCQRHLRRPPDQARRNRHTSPENLSGGRHARQLSHRIGRRRSQRRPCTGTAESFLRIPCLRHGRPVVPAG